jgi:cytochrome c-type biogenesis protein CcmH
MRRSRAALLLLLSAGACALAGPSATLAAAKPSLATIERQFMCVTCKIPLNIAQSQQADRERAFIQGLIDQGRSEAQIKRAMVGQYGSSVLGLPAAHGFDLAAYLIPVAVVVALLGLVAMLLPRWRRRAGTEEDPPPAPPKLDASDSARLDADLARFN